MIVGADERPSVVLAVCARGSDKGVVYPVSEVAAKYGVSVEKETTEPDEAYADLTKPIPLTYRRGWLPNS
jgi:hypothetical protein